ncbi:MAG: hypothetical protein D6746_14780 [Bacteroidetes bacterium]|nr:MAG: hypothetical protein D6746_14780 [Bacteroidota bacterium]
MTMELDLDQQQQELKGIAAYERMSPEQIRAVEASRRIGEAASRVRVVKGQGLVPVDGMGMMWLAKQFADAGLAKDLKTPQQYAVVIQAGLERGLGPLAAIEQMTLIRGRLCLWGTGPMALVMASGLLKDYKGDYFNMPPANTKLTEWPDEAGYRCSASRKDNSASMEYEFTVGDARLAGLWAASTWATHPKRMLKARAQTFLLRDLFPDVLMGLATEDEVEEVHAREQRLESVTGESLEDRRQRLMAANSQEGDNSDDDSKNSRHTGVPA